MEHLQNPLANPAVVLREEFDDWAVLFNPDTGHALGINPVGVYVWKMLDGTRDLGDIIAGVQSGFAGVTESVMNDVSAFLRDLIERGFVGYEVKS